MPRSPFCRWLPLVLVAGACDRQPVSLESVPPAIAGRGAGEPAASGALALPRAGHDDPSRDGWSTEQATIAIGEQLAELKKYLTGDAVRKGSLDSVLAEGFACGEVMPAKASVVFNDGVFVVRRGACAGSLRAQSSVEFGEALDRLHAGGRRFAAIKVVRISREPEGLVAGFDFELNESTTVGARQLNAVWESLWTDEAVPRMARLRVSEFEEATRGGSASFVDETYAVLGGTRAWSEQLAHGIDHWTERLEMHLGTEVNGWNGLALGDADGDGLDDLYYCETGGLPNRLFRHRPDGSLEDITEAAGVGWLDCTQSALFVDLDNDGDQDLIAATTEAVLFHENDGRGRFSLRTTKLQPAGVAFGMAAADFNADGLLDVYVACYYQRRGVNPGYVYARPVPYHEAQNGPPNVLYRNDGNWQFTQATRAAGLDENNRRFSFAPGWDDFDGDGDMDLYVANDFGSKNLYRCEPTADGIHRFRDVAAELGVADPGSGMSVSWGDCDNDGRRDLYVGNMFSSAGNRITRQQRFMPAADPATVDIYRRFARGNSLFRQREDGTFEDISESAGVAMGRWAWSSLFADLNNDGWQDLAVANGFITQSDPHDL